MKHIKIFRFLRRTTIICGINIVTEIHLKNKDSSRDNPKNTKIMSNENPKP